MTDSAPVDMTVTGLHRRYRNGELTPQTLITDCRQRSLAATDNPAWIRLLSEAELARYLARLEGESPDTLPLYGIPFAIKDNIDLAHVPTTAACPAYSHTPARSAFVVQKLIESGAIPLAARGRNGFWSDFGCSGILALDHGA